jgi:PAS domain S-box-containing protein
MTRAGRCRAVGVRLGSIARGPWYCRAALDTRPRIVVIGGDADARSQIVTALERGGFSDVIVHADVPGPCDADAPDAGAAAGQPIGRLCPEPLPGAPDLVVTVGGVATCEQARKQFPDVPVLAALDDAGAAPGARAAPDAAATALRAGADEVVLAPLEVPVLVTRARRLISAAQTQRKAHCLAGLQEALLDILRLGATGGDSPEMLRQALVVATDVLEFDRASLIAHAVGSDLGYVIAATDEPDLAHFAIAMDKYPELTAAMGMGKPILLDDARTSPVMAPVVDTLVDKEVRGVAVFPVLWNGEVLGAVQFRRARPGVRHVNPYRQTFAVMFADLMAARLQHGKVLESLREKTQRLSRTRFEVERRLRTIDALKEHFEAAADGVLVLDAEGRVLFVNSTAEQITGFARESLIDAEIDVLVPEAERERVRLAVAEVLQGHNVEAFDLDLNTTSGESICVSVTTSTVLGQSGAAILMFRDVTHQRALESELRKTKDFLERLIDATVDAIVAADLRGNILIFNKGAERIFGYTAEEVLGRRHIWDLYAAKVPQRVMRMLRSTQYGGPGRIDQIRHEILNGRGDRVPVNMTASIVYEDGREAATVAIFSDLRDRIRIEQRLLQAQEKLEVTEQQAMLAQLAGTAAHELNQPLTSLQALAEMLRRQGEEGAPYMRYVDSIVEQIDRIGSIVRRIGKITKYETKQYMPGTWIVDLDKSSPIESESGADGHLPEPVPEPVPEHPYDYDYVPEIEFADDSEITLAREVPGIDEVPREVPEVVIDEAPEALIDEAPEEVTGDRSNHGPDNASDDDEAEEKTAVRRSAESLARSEEDRGGPEGSTP